MTIDTGVRWVGSGGGGGLSELVAHSGGVVITLVIIFIITFVIIPHATETRIRYCWMGHLA